MTFATWSCQRREGKPLPYGKNATAIRFAQKFWRGKPEEFAAGGRDALEFQGGDAGFFQRGHVVLRPQSSGDEIIQVGSVAEAEDDCGVFVLG